MVRGCEVRIYVTPDGREPYTEWEKALKDRVTRARVGREGLHNVVLLCGGDKGSQKKDIRRAEAYWREYRSRENDKD